PECSIAAWTPPCTRTNGDALVWRRTGARPFTLRPQEAERRWGWMWASLRPAMRSTHSWSTPPPRAAPSAGSRTPAAAIPTWPRSSTPRHSPTSQRYGLPENRLQDGTRWKERDGNRADQLCGPAARPRRSVAASPSLRDRTAGEVLPGLLRLGTVRAMWSSLPLPTQDARRRRADWPMRIRPQFLDRTAMRA